jgi:precorrin-8X/cobalt-precorrin-8 methylmutase
MLPHEIEQESFRIIRSEMAPHNFSDEELAIVVRVIHATADFDFQHIMRFHPRAVEAGLAALRRGATIVTDVRMVEAGISRAILTELGGHTVCSIGDPDVLAATPKLLTAALSPSAMPPPPCWK